MSRHECGEAPVGIQGKDFHEARLSKHTYQYRLWRRGTEIEKAVCVHRPGPLDVVIDLGTADGLMLSRFVDSLAPGRAIGVDASADLLACCRDSRLELIEADAARVPLPDGIADCVVMAAVLEHVADPQSVVAEAARLLRSGGLAVATTPAPLQERLATRLGLLPDGIHRHVLSKEVLIALAANVGLEVLEYKRFMVAGFAVPFEPVLEWVLRAVRLQPLLLNQLIVAQKPLRTSRQPTG